MDIFKTLDTRTIKVLDHGYVHLIDVMPRVLEDGESCDTAIVDAARVSYQKGTTRKSTDKNLINYLMRHKHSSPSEMVEFKFECKMPMFVARQWIRHRTASVNEESARYSELKEEFYEPLGFRQQSDVNKQATSDELFNPFLTFDDEPIQHYAADEESEYYTATEELARGNEDSYDLYQRMLGSGIAREQARMVLPVNIYTSWVWKIDLHNLLHFLKLRLDKHAQYEIRVFAEAIAQFVKQLCPWTWEAFENHVLNAETFSKKELDMLGMLLKEKMPLQEFINAPVVFGSPLSGGESREFIEKLKRLL